MSFKSKTLEELAKRRSQLNGKAGLVGFDGFIDLIKQPVDQRHGPGGDFTPIPTITAFGERILAAGGKSTNIELHPVREKLGGNGPILAHALLQTGLKLRYIGALGSPSVHQVFEEFAKRAEAVSLCEPSLTHALEFTDGKLLLGEMASLSEITYDTLIAKTGEGAFFDMISRVDLLAMVNWTMIPHMTDLLQSLLDRVFPNLPPRDMRLFFFDLADPEKRSDGDLRGVLQVIRRYQDYGSVTLGLNLKEAQRVAAVLGVEPGEPDPDSLRRLASAIRREQQIDTVVIHPRERAVCATREDTWHVPGPLTEAPRITTGGGDHFNAGFLTGQLMSAPPEACLALGVAASGFYVRQGRSPSLNDLDQFIRQWK